VGGEISEKGVDFSDAALIEFAREELRHVLPGVNFGDTQWATYRINRAEGRNSSNRRPEGTVWHREGSIITAWPTKLVLAPTGYGHFHVEHNRGHHRDVATPDDPASSRMGESIYAFVVREIPGAWRRAWRLERERMQGLGRSRFSLHNDIVQTSLITLALWTTLIAWLGIGVLPFLIAASFWANFQLTSANYIEHYGIARKRLPNGRYEPCKPEHSWNSNHLVSNWALFHLQRHSDHHANATRRYQCLRHFDEAPQLPTGYFGMFLLSYVPPLWFRVMDPRLLAMVGRDPERINAQPSQRQHLFARHGLAAPP
jgi:alkane 1-monooxygenase